MQQSSLESVASRLRRGRLVAAVIALGLSGVLGSACADKGEVSAKAATAHVALLVETTARDVEEVRTGLPQGAKHLVSLWSVAPAPPVTAPPATSAAPAGSASAAPGGSAAPLAVPSAPSAVSPPTASPPASVAPVAPGSGAPSAAAPPAMPPSPPDAVGSASASAASAAPPVAAAPVAAAAPEPGAVRAALHQARSKVQDLRVAKSTFFALADPQGIVLRNDQDQDQMVGRGLFEAYPALRQALTGTYVETMGSMPEAAGIASRADAQWVAAAPVMQHGQVKGLYVTGWSWSAYSKRLQHALRGELLGKLEPGKNEPLVYVVIVVGKDVFGWDAPDVNLQAVVAVDFSSKLDGEAPRSEILEVTGRRWGVAAKLAPALGKGVAVAVLRSET